MTIDFSLSFDRHFAKLSKAQKQLVKDALELFSEDPFHDTLRNHPLTGQWARYRSISADSDLRLHYQSISAEVVLFVAVGSHGQLYK